MLDKAEMGQHIKRGDFTPEEYEIAFGEENHLDSMTFSSCAAVAENLSKYG